MAVSGSELINANMDSENVRAFLERSRKGNFSEFEQAGESICVDC